MPGSCLSHKSVMYFIYQRFHSFFFIVNAILYISISLLSHTAQCGVVITRSIFTQIFTKTPHSSPARATYGVPLVSITSDSYSASVIVIPCGIPCSVGLRYNGSPLDISFATAVPPSHRLIAHAKVYWLYISCIVLSYFTLRFVSKLFGVGFISRFLTVTSVVQTQILSAKVWGELKFSCAEFSIL